MNSLTDSIQNIKILLFIIVILFSCAKKPSQELAKEEKKQPDIVIIQDFDQDSFRDGIWEDNTKDGVITFTGGISNLEKYGDKGNSLCLDYDFRLSKDIVGGVWFDFSEYNFAGFNYFGFWVKGEPSLGFANIIGICFEDAKGARETKMFGEVQDSWQKVEIPLKEFKINLSELKEVNITMDKRFATPKIGRIYLDSFYLR